MIGKITEAIGKAYHNAVPGYSAFLDDGKFLILGIMLVFIAYMGFYAIQLDVDSSQKAFYYENDPVVLKNNLVDGNFNSADALTVFIRLDKSSDEFDRITDIRDEQVIEYIDTIRLKFLQKGFTDFVLTPNDNPALFNREGTSALILVYMDTGNSDKQLEDRKMQVEEILENTKTPSGIRTSAGGSPIIFSEVSRLLFSDLIVTGLASLIVIAFAVRLFYGSNAITAVNLFLLACIMTCIFGSMKLLGVPLNIATALIAVLTIGLGVDYTLHLQNGFLHGTGRRRYVVSTVLQRVGPPLSMAFLTTLIGFMSLFFAGSKIMEDLALSTSIGIIYVYMFNMILTPVIFLIFGSGEAVSNGKPSELTGFLHDKMIDLSDLIGNHTFLFIAAVLAFAIVAIYGITMVNTETDYSGFIPSDNPVLMDLVEQADAFPGSTNRLNIIIEADDVLQYDVLREVDEFEKRIEGMEYVESVSSPVDLIKEMNGGAIPETRARIVHPDVGSDYKMMRITVNYAGQIANNQDLLVGKFLPSIRERFPQKYETYFVGDAAFQIRENEITSSGSAATQMFSYVAIFILLILYFRSVTIGFMMLLPIILAISSTMGIDGWTGIPFSQITSSIFGILIGIGMDFSIHTGSEMKKFLEHGSSYAGAVEGTHQHLAKLLFLTSLTTVLGFLTLNFAELSFLQDLGKTLAFGILFAFLYSLILLPGLIIGYAKITRAGGKLLGKINLRG